MKKITELLREVWKIFRGSGTSRITMALIYGGLGLIGTPLWQLLIKEFIKKQFDLIIPNQYGIIIGFLLIITGLFYHYLFHRNITNKSNPITKIDSIRKKKLARPETVQLIDSFPKDNATITTNQVKSIYFKFNKPITKQSEKYIHIKLIRVNSRIQCNNTGWFQREENNTKLIWHIHDTLLNKEGYFIEPKEHKDQSVFEIHLGNETKESRLEADDHSILPHIIIRVKISG